MVEAAKHVAAILVLIKVSANWSGLRRAIAVCLQAGAYGITAIDSIGLALEIDVETGRPQPASFAWLCGEAIRPIALRVVVEVFLRHDVPVVGTGGQRTPENALEVVMAGRRPSGCTPPRPFRAWSGSARPCANRRGAPHRDSDALAAEPE
jgi:dihydroorotate dehydrogenase